MGYRKPIPERRLPNEIIRYNKRTGGREPHATYPLFSTVTSMPIYVLRSLTRTHVLARGILCAKKRGGLGSPLRMPHRDRDVHAGPRLRLSWTRPSSSPSPHFPLHSYRIRN
jgi:hypothetical protein